MKKTTLCKQYDATTNTITTATRRGNKTIESVLTTTQGTTDDATLTDTTNALFIKSAYIATFSAFKAVFVKSGDPTFYQFWNECKVHLLYGRDIDMSEYRLSMEYVETTHTYQYIDFGGERKRIECIPFTTHKTRDNTQGTTDDETTDALLSFWHDCDTTIINDVLHDCLVTLYENARFFGNDYSLATRDDIMRIALSTASNRVNALQTKYAKETTTDDAHDDATHDDDDDRDEITTDDTTAKCLSQSERELMNDAYRVFKSNVTRIRKLNADALFLCWYLNAMRGKTERAISKALNIPPVTVHDAIHKVNNTLRDHITVYNHSVWVE